MKHLKQKSTWIHPSQIPPKHCESKSKERRNSPKLEFENCLAGCRSATPWIAGKWPLKWRTIQTSKRRKKYEKLTWERSMTSERQVKAEAYPYLAAVRRRARRKPKEMKENEGCSLERKKNAIKEEDDHCFISLQRLSPPCVAGRVRRRRCWIIGGVERKGEGTEVWERREPMVLGWEGRLGFSF